MNILIVEDSLTESIYLNEIIEKLGYNVVANVRIYQQPLEIIDSLSIDLVLLHIELNGEANGLDLAKKLNQRQIPIVIVTNNNQDAYYEKVKRINNCLFLTKPINIHTLDSSIRVLTQTIDKTENFLKDGLRGPIIAIKDILFIHVIRTYSYIHTNSRRYAFKKSLKSIKAQLPVDAFLQIHSSYLVQKSYIKQINLEKNLVELEGFSLPLSRRAKKEINAHR